MRTTIIPLYVVVGILAVAVAMLWLEREGGPGATNPSPRMGLVIEPAATSSVRDRDPAAANSNVDQRLAEMSQRIDGLSAEVEQLKASSDRSAVAAPQPTEAEFADRHRAA